MLTSFGLEQCLTSASDIGSPFYRMPPVSFRTMNESFMPDYELLFLCDKIVMDEGSFERLGSEIHGEGHGATILSLMVEQGVRSSEKCKLRAYRHALRGVLRAYLMYVNSNLILSNTLQVGFHDWLDFTPFYGSKFLAI